MYADSFEYNNSHSADFVDTPYNNNDGQINRRISFSSVSSYHSDSGEDCEKVNAREFSQEKSQETNKSNIKLMRQRSMSDVGLQNVSPTNEEFEIFPSLPDSVLEKMGLKGNGPHDRLSEEELEQKFTSLSLAFTIDSTTIKDRCERQRRQRDQTETNLNKEIERLIQRANRIQHLCIDSETTELLTSLLTQIDIVARAAIHGHTTAEKYGAVQHEERLSESVSLMLNYVNNLKQQRDSARRQLQYTKRVLQDNVSHDSLLVRNQNKTGNCSNNKLLTRRRASIATFNQSQESSPKIDNRKSLRRTSDLTLRASSASRNIRPNRLELSLDLVKIKEGSIELDTQSIHDDFRDGSESAYTDDDTNQTLKKDEDDLRHLPIRQKVRKHFYTFLSRSRSKFKEWTEDGTWHEICCFCALLCFTFSLITMTNILLEMESAKNRIFPSKWFWFLTTGDEQELLGIVLEAQHPKVITVK